MQICRVVRVNFPNRAKALRAVPGDTKHAKFHFVVTTTGHHQLLLLSI